MSKDPMDENKDVALRQLNLLAEIRPSVFEEFKKNDLKNGYVFVSITDTFKVAAPPRFIQREIDKEEFVNFLDKQTQAQDKWTPQSQEPHWVYYEIYWQHTKASWHLKEPLMPS